MSGQPPRGWNPRAPAHNAATPSPSFFMYRPPSPWTPVAPSPPPIISGPRLPPLQSPIQSSPTPFRPLPTAYGGANIPRPFRPPVPQQNSYNATGGGGYGAHPISSFQLSPTPSPIVCQTPNSDFMFNSNRQTPMSHLYETQQQQAHQQQQQPHQQRHFQQPQQQPPIYSKQPQPQSPYHQQSHNQQQQFAQNHQQSYDYVGVPLEPPQPKSYVIYDDEEEFGPSTAEIIANQSQDYIDEKLAEYQMTILQLQGEYSKLG